MIKRKHHLFVFTKQKPVLSIIVFYVIIFVIGYLAGISLAKNDSKIVLLENSTTQNISRTEIINNKPNTKWQTVRMRVTAYCPCPICCGKYSDGITACGHKINHNERFIAADKKYPFGTKMRIPGYNDSKTVEVLDRGGKIQGNRIDVFFNSHDEALEWGVQYLDVKILVQ